jgi:general secretion pathway protein C
MVHISGMGDRFGLTGAHFARACTILLVLALAASVAGWALEFTARRTPSEAVQPVTTGDAVARTQPADIAPVAQMFGARAGSGAADIKLIGVIAEGAKGRGIALLAVDGRPALPTRAGEDIASGVTLTEVRADGVLVSRSGTVQELHLPVKPAPDGIVKVPN